MNEKELEHLEDDLMKDINQSDSIDKELVDQELQGMGFLKIAVDKKLSADAICFKCKKKMNFKIDRLNVKEANSQPGTISFVGLCQKCNDELEAEIKKKE